MSSELKKRIFVTLGFLLVARVLAYLPLPGVNLTSIFKFWGAASRELVFGSGAYSRATIGALGIAPYLTASILVVLFFYFRKFRHGADDREVAVEFNTFILTGVIALLQGYSIAVFLENIRLPNGIVIVANPGWGFRLSTMLTLTAGTFLLVWLANSISQNGLGNGVCLLVLVQLLAIVPRVLLDLWPKLKPGNLNIDTFMRITFFVIPPAVILFLVIIVLIMAKWNVSLWSLGRDTADNPLLLLRVNGVGIAGVKIARSVLFVPASLAVIVPADFAGRLLLQKISEPGIIQWLTLGMVAFAMTYLLTAWAYQPRGLQTILNRFDNASEPAQTVILPTQFDRKLAIVTLFPALVIPFIFVVFLALAQKFSFRAFSAIGLFIIVAIAVDLFRQFKVHQQMATLIAGNEEERVCGNCQASISNEETFCPACGIVFEENLRCDIHPEATALAVCIICKRKLCEDCIIDSQDRFTCAEHSGVELIEGWATAMTSTTRLEAEICQQHLEKLGIPALVLSNTIEPQYGTLGIFEINPVTPLLVYRELGGGRIRLMVPAYDLMRAQEYFAGIWEEKANCKDAKQRKEHE